MPKISWGAADLDAAASTQGLVHESVANTDHTSTTTMKQGYSAAAPLHSTNTASLWLFHEDSGTTLYDHVGSRDGTNNGAAVGQTGIFGTTAYTFGSGDSVTLPNFGNFSAYTVTVLFRPSAVGNLSYNAILTLRANNGTMFRIRDTSSDLDFFHDTTTVGSSTLSNGTLYAATITWDGATAEAFLNASSVGTLSSSTNGADGLATDEFGQAGSGQQYKGDIIYGRVDTAALSASQVTDIHNVLLNPGTLVTTEKVP